MNTTRFTLKFLVIITFFRCQFSKQTNKKKTIIKGEKER